MLRLERDSQPLLALLREVEAGQEVAGVASMPSSSLLRPVAAGEVQVMSLLAAMSAIERSRLATPLAPTSYLSGLHRDISLSIAAGFSDVILPALRSELLAKADSILRGPVGPQRLDGAMAASRLQTPHDHVTTYLRELRDLGGAVNHYNVAAFTGAKDELRDLAALIPYLYNRDLPAEFLNSDHYYRDALFNSSAPPISDREQERQTVRALEQAEQIFQNAYDELAAHLTVIERNLQIARQVQVTDSELNDLRALPERIRLVNSYFGDSSIPWLDPQAPLGAGVLLLTDSIPANPLFSRERLLRDVGPLFEEVRAERLAELTRGGGVDASLFAINESGATVLAPHLVALGRNLEQMMAQPFIRGSGAPQRGSPSAVAGGRIGWDVSTLDRALGAHEAFENFFSSGVEGVSPDFEHLLYLTGSLHL
jgi:hypothetical protein